MKSFLSIVCFVLSISSFVLAKGKKTSFIKVNKTNSNIQIKLQDKESNESIPMASIILQREDGLSKFIRTDIDGFANVQDLKDGKYTLKVITYGFIEKQAYSMNVKQGKSVEVIVNMLSFYNPKNIKKITKVTTAEF